MMHKDKYKLKYPKSFFYFFTEFCWYGKELAQVLQTCFLLKPFFNDTQRNYCVLKF